MVKENDDSAQKYCHHLFIFLKDSSFDIKSVFNMNW